MAVISAQGFQKKISSLPKDKLLLIIKDSIQFVTTLLVTDIRRTALSGPTGATSVSSRSGKLRQNIRPAKVEITPDSVVRGGVTAGTRYATVHIVNGAKSITINPVKSQWLTIPLPDAKTKAGVTRGSAESFNDTLFVKIKKTGNIFICKRKYKKKKGLFWLFLLRKKVVVKSRVDTGKYVKKAMPVLKDRIVKGIVNAF